MAKTPYPPDEFDRLPEGSPVGAHRRVPRTWTRALAFVGVVVGSLGLAWGAAQVLLLADDVSWLSWLRGTAASLQAPAVTPPATPSETPSPSVTVSPSVSPTVSPSASPSPGA